MKNTIFFFVLLIAYNSYAQKLTQKEITEWYILNNEHRNDRLKYTDKIAKVEIYLYSKEADVKNPSDEHLLSKEILVFDEAGKIVEKSIKTAHTHNYHKYMYDNKGRVTKSIDSSQYRDRDFVVSKTLFTYSDYQTEKIIFDEGEPVSKLIFSVQDGIVKSYEDAITKSNYLHIEFDIVAQNDFYDYVEGIDTSEANFKNLLKDCPSCESLMKDRKLTVVENKDFKRNFKYENGLLVQEKVYDKGLKSLKNTINYTYDAQGNWIAKTDLYWEKPFSHVVRKIYYR
ncbi:YD repeat-containing protein [Kordia periserrulae]|uniref:YD repeat-containing protein n=1 Tax=Kordia periserrulae TaxID=701523 RepID=A0A2T6C5Y5_9FLAO|nr:hypothetical protein [Kordia periserrulae]PTX63739.1 YD repeat-containing protein [Kordia periserrulae]